MVDSWSQTEVEAAVADYFAMLECELKGTLYNKSEHRRSLLQKLRGRSEAAVERKHANTSAVLIDLGFPYIAGYKPLGNYQVLLRDVVAARLDADCQISDFAMEQVSAAAEVPAVEDILSVLVNPPKSPEPTGGLSDSMRVPRKVNFLEVEARNRSLGDAGEEFVLRFEKARLVAASKEKYAERVERVSKTQGDGLGYDIRSFEISGKDRFIEVKTTSYGPLTPFFVTRNELAASEEKGRSYHLYRAYGFRRDPRIFWRNGPLDGTFRLLPSVYQALIV